MAVTMRITGLDEVLRNNAAMRERLADMSGVLAIAGEDLKTFVDNRFETATAPSGEEWAPLAPQTVARRREQSDTPLVDTGILRNSIAASVQRNTLTIGTNVEYALFHQQGTKTIPARSFIPTAEDLTSGPAKAEVDALKAMILRWVVDGEGPG